MRYDFDDGWQFHAGDIPAPVRGCPMAVKAGYGLRGWDPEIRETDWRPVRLPHDWAIENAPTPDAMPEQGSYPRGIGWYRKSFRLPGEAGQRKRFLEFEGIGRNASVWVNGFFLGSHPSGYTPFLCDLTDVVPRWQFQEQAEPPDDGRPDIVTVRVDAQEPEGWWYEGCGMYRHVWLHVLDRLRFDRYGAWCETPSVTEKRAAVRFHGTVVNDYEEPRNTAVRLSIRDGEGREAAAAVSAPLTLAPGDHEVDVDATIHRPRLWSPEDPYLYRVRAELVRDGATVDTRDLPLGVRWFSFDAAHGFSLNGLSLKLRGVNCHQDFAGVGVALPDRLHEKRVELIKEMGANAFRCAHNPPAPAFLDACDRLGLLVIDENRKLDISPEGLNDLRLMVRRDRHHPCIFAWCLCNEEFAATRPLAAKALRTLARTVRHEDPTRPVTFTGNNFADGAGTQACCWRTVDLVGRNYGWQAYAQEHARFPEFKCLSTEFSALRETRGAYLDTGGMGGVAVPLETPLLPETAGGPGESGPVDAAGNTLAASFRDLVWHWRAIAQRDDMAGGFLWTAMDYRGESSWPRIHSEFGVMDLCGFPKDSYSYFRAWWRPDEPLVHLFPHWTWPGREGRPVCLRAVGNCEEVELQVNGVSMGRQPVPPLGFVEWRTEYQPGRIVAIGFRRGRETCRDEVRTAGDPARLKLTADRVRLTADGRDVACVTVAVLDAAGAPVPTARIPVCFEVEGAGRYLGSGNGDPCDHTPDGAPVRHTFAGLGLILVQADTGAGEIRLRANAEGLPAALVVLQATP